MKRKSKIIICIIGIILGLSLIGGSLYLAKNNPSNIKGTTNNQGERPSMPNQSNGNGQNNSSTDSSTDNTRPTLPSGNDSKSDKSGKQNMGPNNSQEALSKINFNNIGGLNIWYIVGIGLGSLLFSLSLIYLIISKFAVNNIFTSFKNILIFIIINMIIISILTFGIVKLSNKFLFSNTMPQEIPTENNSENTKTNDSTSTSVWFRL